MRPKLRATRRSESAKGPSAAAVLTKATRRAAQLLGLRDSALADVLGVSPSTVSRMSEDRPIDPESDVGERALLFLRIFRGLDALLGDSDSCRKWLKGEHTHLRGVPADLIRSVEGLVNVAQYLDAMRGKL